MLEILNFIGMDLPVDWYFFQKVFPEKSNRFTGKLPQSRPIDLSGVIHDGTYPVLPAVEVFSSVCAKLRQVGGHVKPCVVSRLYDPGIDENAPFAAQAKLCVVRDVQGQLSVSKKYFCWRMCYHPQWWQQRLKEIVVSLVKNENVDGIYFDTFYGGYYQCFDTEHGHSHGGGNDMYLGAHKIAEVVRGAMKLANPQAVATGENPAEVAIDMLDGFLMRWTVWPEMAPLLAAVYGDYICHHPVSLSSSDGFYVQAAVMFIEGGQMGRLLGFGDMDKMRFLRKLCHYWKPQAGGRFLAYGKLLRPIQFSKPDPMPTFSYNETSRYVSHYKKGLITVPALMNGVFKTDDGDLGIFIVNVSDKPVRFSFELTADRYPISKSANYQLTRIGPAGKKGKTSLHKGIIAYKGKIAGYDVRFLDVKEQHSP